MKHWFILFAVVAVTSAVAAPQRAPARKNTPTYWYQMIARYEDQSDNEWLVVSQPRAGKLAGFFLWPKVDGAGKPYVQFLKLEGTVEKGKVWLASPNNTRYTGRFTSDRYAGNRLSLTCLNTGMKFDFRKRVPPNWHRRPWKDFPAE